MGALSKVSLDPWTRSSALRAAGHFRWKGCWNVVLPTSSSANRLFCRLDLTQQQRLLTPASQPTPSGER